MWLLSLLSLAGSAASQVPPCQCEKVPTIAASDHYEKTYHHHQITLPSLNDLKNLTQEVNTILTQISCSPTTFEAGPGEALFICPAAFIPCPHLTDLDRDVLKACNEEQFAVPLPILIHHGELYRVDEIHAITKQNKTKLDPLLDLSS